jgi:succinate dehydrogenase / fumarate reductase cytochrome b subunit
MNFITRIWRSSVGQKFIMGLTGLVLFGFVAGHLVGNLQVFLGPEPLNRYGAFLQSSQELLWIVRSGLIACVVLHVLTAVRLSAANKAARPVGYEGASAPVAASYASRTMLMSGLIIAAFIVYHLLHYTAVVKGINFAEQDFGSFHDEKGRHDVYRMLIVGFQQPIVALFYVVAMGLLCLHLSHGVEAMFQSLGVRVGFCPCLPKCLAKWGAVLIFLGYASIPAAIMGGLGAEYAKNPPHARTAGKEAK